MSFRQDRRRRVLTDDVLSGTSSAVSDQGAGTGATTPHEAYTAAARRAEQPPITDLVPISWLAWSMYAILAGLTIGGLEAAYHWLPQLQAAAADAEWRALDLAAPHNAAHWLSALWLGSIAPLAIIVYRLRSHRIDDYRGRYRMWAWVVPAAVLLSINETAGLSHIGQGLVHWSTRGTSFAPTWLWTVASASVWGLLAVRVLIEMRHSLIGSAALLLAAGDLLALATLESWSPWDLTTRHAIMAVAGLRMLGHALLLASVTLYARHVILDAEGHVAHRPKKKARPKKRAAKSDSSSSGEAKDEAESPRKAASGPTRTDLDTDQRGPATRPQTVRHDPAEERRRTATAPHQSRAASNDDEDAEEDDAGDGDGDDRAMTRAERKRLRRQQRQGR